MSRAARLAAAVVLGLAASACGSDGAGRGAASPTSGSVERATDFAARDIEGKTFKLSDHLGKDVVLLNFWSTFCEPCLHEFPHMRKLQDKYRGKGLVIVAVAMDGPETVAQVEPFARRNQLNFPVLLDEDSHVVSIYNPKKSAPMSIVIDRSGKVVSRREGYNPGDEEFLEADVVKLLDAPAAGADPATAPPTPASPAAPNAGSGS